MKQRALPRARRHAAAPAPPPAIAFPRVVVIPGLAALVPGPAPNRAAPQTVGEPAPASVAQHTAPLLSPASDSPPPALPSPTTHPGPADADRIADMYASFLRAQHAPLSAPPAGIWALEGAHRRAASAADDGLSLSSFDTASHSSADPFLAWPSPDPDVPGSPNAGPDGVPGARDGGAADGLDAFLADFSLGHALARGWSGALEGL